MIAALLILSSTVMGPDLVSIRSSYAKSLKSESEAKLLISLLEGVEERSAIHTAYLGAANMLMANHYFFPTSKYNAFVKGRKLLEGAVAEDSSSPEVRYLRFVNQVETPKILRYKSNLDEDLKIIIDGYGAMDDDLKRRVEAYMNKCEYLTREQQLNFVTQ